MSVDLNSQTQQNAELVNQQEDLLANYGGWQDPDPSQTAHQPNGAASSKDLPLLDEDDHVTPDLIQQERPWWMSGAPRAIVVVSAIVALLYVLFSMFGLWGQDKQPSSSLTSIDPATIDQEATARIKQLQAENENLKRSQVMGEPLPQRDPDSRQVKPAAVPPKPRVVYTPAPPPRRTEVTAAPTRVSRPTYTPPQVPTPKSPSTVEANSKKDPMEQWLAASQIGIWGGSSKSESGANLGETSNSISTTNDRATFEESNSSSWQIKGGSGQVPIQTKQARRMLAQTERIPSIAPTVAIVNRPAEASLNNLEPRSNETRNDSSFGERQLVVGTEIEGKLQTDIRWSSEIGEQLARKILIQIKEPLLDVSGLEVFPKGTLLVARIDNTFGSGAVTMSIAAAITPKGFERELPPQAILVLDRNGDEVLQADTKRKNRRGNGFGSLVLSGISGATGEIDSTIGRSAARAAVQQARNRTYRRQGLDDGRTSFVLKQGTSVRLYVNQSIDVSIN